MTASFVPPALRSGRDIKSPFGKQGRTTQVRLVGYYESYAQRRDHSKVLNFGILSPICPLGVDIWYKPEVGNLLSH